MPSAAKAVAPAKFSGFPKQAIEFYRGVEKNNTREFFEQHRAEYIEHVVTPARAFVNEMGPKLRNVSAGVSYSPDYTGKGSIKKIHTDSRFVKDRAPLKTYLDIMFWEGPLAAKKDNSVFFLRLSPQGLGLVTGAKGFDKLTLKAYRVALTDPKAARELQAILAKLEKQGYEVKGATLKQTPRGFDKTLPWADLALHEALFAAIDLPLPSELHSPKLMDLALKHWKAMAPLHIWLVQNVFSRL
jgi:uncharacterized protein (TIGR02453 family)